MKTIGLLGGMSWESTIPYYQVINETVKEQLGGLHSAKCLLYSVDFDEIENYQSTGEWEKAGAVLADAAQRLEKAGADLLVICTNTMHKVAPSVQSAVQIPLLHIAEVTARSLREKRIKTAALLGTRYTMEQDFYKRVIEENGIRVIVPEEEERALIHEIIFRELCLGILKESSREKFLSIIHSLRERGAEGVILGCTEIGLLVTGNETDVPLFDTTILHAREAALMALREDGKI